MDEQRAAAPGHSATGALASPRSNRRTDQCVGRAGRAERGSINFGRLPRDSTEVGSDGATATHRFLTLLPWLIVALLLSGVAFFVLDAYVPMVSDVKQLRRLFSQTALENEQLSALVRELQATTTQLKATRDSMLGDAARQQEKAKSVAGGGGAAWSTLLDGAARQLSTEIASGEVRLAQSGAGHASLLIAERLLFDAAGDVAVSARGKAFLRRVGAVLQQAPEAMVQVGAHTDSTAPTPPAKRGKKALLGSWELCALRASSVARFLQTDSKLAGERLTVASFAEFRPLVSSGDDAGALKSRRIEIVLSPKAVVSAEAPAAKPASGQK